MQFSDYITLVNPIFYTAVMFITLYGGSVVLIKYVIKPQERKYDQDTKRLMEERRQFGMLMNDLSPIAVLQSDRQGKLTFWNTSGEELIGKKWEDREASVDIYSVHPSFTGIELGKIISEGLTERIEIVLKETSYLVEIKGVASHEFAHFCFMDISAIKEQEKLLKEYHNNIRKALEDERERLAKNLHDGHSQSLVSVKLLASRMLEKSSLNPDQSKMLKSIVEEMDQSIEEVHEIVYSLKPKQLKELGLTVALQAMVQRIGKNTGIVGEFQTNIKERSLDSDLELSIYRMMQELLTNIAKHSKAESFLLQVMFDGESITIVLSDDGIGMSAEYQPVPSTQGGWGLFNLREDIKYLGGRMELISAPGEGTEFVIEIPVSGKKVTV